MYPGVIVEFEDRSNITPVVSTTEVRNRPLFGAVFTSDKGTEEWVRCTKDNFFDIYGKNISFSRHGQPLLQAAMTVNAGGELLCKRLVSDDATLANIGVLATIVETSIQATDEAGNLLWQTAEGGQTSDRGASNNTPVMTTKVGVQYSTISATNAKTLDDAVTSIKATLTDEAIADRFLLFVIADNGRGVSSKRIQITPNYRISKTLNYTQYTLNVIEGGTVTESIAFCANPDTIIGSTNMSIASMVNSKSTQIVCSTDTSGFESFVSALSSKLTSEEDPVTTDYLYSNDVLFGCTNKGVNTGRYVIDLTGGGAKDIQTVAGLSLDNGANGTFGTHPITNTAEFAKQGVAALDGSFSTEIYNVDHYRINAFVDANYPVEVKRAIAALATFREDFIYFRDQGLGINSMDKIVAAYNSEVKNMFCASYFQSYDVIDPYSKKQITVTIGYNLAQLLVAHWNNGSIMPTAGLKHNMVIRDAIYGTLSFAPIICPDPRGNEKEALEDMHVNYASYIDNQLVIESLYTSQEVHSQWSYINNVSGIQDVIKDIRRRCPVVRYTFIDGEDLEKYRADVEEVIAPYRSNFASLELEYMEDTTYAANKIFYAVLNVRYRDFVQTERFKVTALSSSESIEV